uniref:Exostosin GT47 domain-containing protein n=1 Tax=Ananas comosus var. bracteatus TaxID=296719 RepID=A0A6V7PK04_ANACO|nr:unnamed protein product [Ananas comosus var. bracteatus]
MDMISVHLFKVSEQLEGHCRDGGFEKPEDSPHSSSPVHVTKVAAASLHLHLSPVHRAGLVLSILSIQFLLLLPTLYSRFPRFLSFFVARLFNRDLLAACDALDPWTSRCVGLSNAGFGPPAAANLKDVLPSLFLPHWFATDQFNIEPIFHRRLLTHRCRTTDPSAATAFYIPFYAGLAVGRYILSANATNSDRDHDCSLLLSWIRRQAPYRRSNGSDHFIAIGRITWDFRRPPDGDWGSNFFNMPGMENVTRLIIERSSSRRFRDDFRGLLLKECAAAGNTLCRAVDCDGSRCANRNAATMSLFLDSTFCLQPNGDSFTRRSMFDCMVAGAIPVLFFRESAYLQYQWYLPVEGKESEWSVFIDQKEVREGNVSVRAVLDEIGEERARQMRERVVDMIPRLIYAAGEQGLGEEIEDAFDIALKGVFTLFGSSR